MHDDQHGTAIISGAALINEDIKKAQLFLAQEFIKN